MKGSLSLTSALLSLLLSTTPAACLPQLVDPLAGTLEWFQFYDTDRSSIRCRGCHDCTVIFGGENGALGCLRPAVIGSQLCVDVFGRRSVGNCDGGLTVDFAATATDPTPVHFTAGNQSYVGGNAPNKVSGSFDYAETGTGAWGSRNYVGSWCVADIIQYQKAKPADPVTSTTAQYNYNVSIWDSDIHRNGLEVLGPEFSYRRESLWG